MKIAFVIYPEVVISNKSNGIRMQALIWGEALKALGHDVVYVNNWDDYDWKSFDIIHLFCYGWWVRNLVKRMKELNTKIVFSPICDPDPYLNYKKEHREQFFSNLTHGRYGLGRYWEKLTYDDLDYIIVRSNFEKMHLNKSVGVPLSKMTVVPLAYDKRIDKIDVEINKKDNFCFHLSSIYQPRKNVIRLIQAAKKYGFKLVLAGNKGNDLQFAPLKREIGDANNIEVLGFISEEEKYELYRRAKVFALPSINSEGVGLVALDAAAMGCEIAITDIGGPKEYYHGMACEVDPQSVDSIGVVVDQLLKGEEAYQPKLCRFVRNLYSVDTTIKQLLQVYSIANHAG